MFVCVLLFLLVSILVDVDVDVDAVVGGSVNVDVVALFVFFVLFLLFFDVVAVAVPFFLLCWLLQALSRFNSKADQQLSIAATESSC